MRNQDQERSKTGDTISPKLFTAILNNIFRRLNWENNGVKIDAQFLCNLRSAGDIIRTRRIAITQHTKFGRITIHQSATHWCSRIAIIVLQLMNCNVMNCNVMNCNLINCNSVKFSMFKLQNKIEVSLNCNSLIAIGVHGLQFTTCT